MALKLNKGKRSARNTYSSTGKSSVPRLRSLRFVLPAARNFKGVLGIIVCAVVGAALLLALCVGTLRLYRFATTSPFFATKHVDVTGNVRMPRDMVLELAGLAIGENSLAVSIAKVERSLLSSPWVEEVSVKRLLPDRFVIKLRERTPSFWIRKDGVLYYADTQGAIIAPVESAHFLSLPTLEVEPGTEDVLHRLGEFIKDLQDGQLPVEFGAVSGINISPGRGVELYLEDRDMRLSVATDDWRGNLDRLGITLGDLARRNELGIVREVRAADGNVWVITAIEEPER